MLLLSLGEALEERLTHSLAVGEHLLVAGPPRRQLDDADVRRALPVGMVVGLGLAQLAQPSLFPSAEQAHYIRKMPNVVSGIGAFSAAEIPRATIRRVSRGSMMPSSHSRAVE